MEKASFCLQRAGVDHRYCLRGRKVIMSLRLSVWASHIVLRLLNLLGIQRRGLLVSVIVASQFVPSQNDAKQTHGDRLCGALEASRCTPPLDYGHRSTDRGQNRPFKAFWSRCPCARMAKNVQVRVVSVFFVILLS